MKLLAGDPIAMHDVRDLEATCRAMIDRKLRSFGVYYISPDDYEELLAEILAVAWEMGCKYDPERVRDPETGVVGMSFSTMLNRFAAPRVVDWYRDEFVDARYWKKDEPRPELVPLEGAAERLEVPGGRGTLVGGEATSYEEVETLACLPAGYYRVSNDRFVELPEKRLAAG